MPKFRVEILVAKHLVTFVEVEAEDKLAAQDSVEEMISFKVKKGY